MIVTHTLTGRIRYRLGGIFRRKLILQVETVQQRKIR